MHVGSRRRAGDMGDGRPPGSAPGGRPIIDVVDLHKSFGGTPVLDGVTFSCAEGTTCVVLGQSGAGKSVLLKHLMGLMRPDRGHVYIDGEDVSALPRDELIRVHGKLGVLFQSSALFDSLSVFDNVAFPLRERAHLDEREIRRRVLERLADMDLHGVEALRPSELSGGMQKRVALARAIVLDPKIMLFDDPTAGLDPLKADHVVDVIRAARTRMRVTSVVITSDLAVAFDLADTVGLLAGGKIAGYGAPDAFRRSTDPAVHAFLHTWDELRDGLRDGATASSPAP